METAAAVWTDRHFPASSIIDQCKGLAASGVVDGVLIPDQLANFIPAQLWNTDNTPLAAMMPDPDSQADAFVAAGYVAGQVPELAIHLTTDSVRRAPAELIQSMLTLAHMTEGKATLQVGGGEIKQTGPFGHPTNQGMSRMGDLFQIYRKIMEEDGPFDFDGKRWTFEKAWIGAAREHKPEIWGLGAGPMLLEHCARWSDGLGTCAKLAFHSPDHLGTAISNLRARVEEHGRDPSQFRIGLWVAALLVDDDGQYEMAVQNEICRFVGGALGRIETHRWADEGEGMALPLPADWTYYKHLVPYAMSDAEVRGIVDNTSPAHMEKAWFIGTPEQVAEEVKPYLEGVDWIAPFDYVPIMNGDDEGGVRRMNELCTILHEL